MLLKFDLSKAFEKLSWDYIEQVLLAFGFDPSWTKSILSLISTAFFSILANGSPSATFPPLEAFAKVTPSLPSSSFSW